MDDPMGNNIRSFQMQLHNIINLLNEKHAEEPTKMLDTLVSRFQHAIVILEKCNPGDIRKNHFKFQGSVRAYLEAYNDYLNPVLEQMDNAESTLNDLFE